MLEPVALAPPPEPEAPAPPLEPDRPTGGATPAVATPSVETTRRLLGASFDLLTRTSDDMRPASFYIGLVTLGTVGPLAVASFALEAVSIHQTRSEMARLLNGPLGGLIGLLGLVATMGLIVAAVESQAVAASILGGRLSERPVTVQAAVARSRMVFWRVIVAGIIVAIPVAIAQAILDEILLATLGPQADVSFVSSTLVAGLVGAPLAYVLAGVVLGDVSPAEATRRSFRVFRARKLAAALVAIFQTVAFLLVLLGLGAGLDLALRVFDALGLGPDSGPAGLALVVIGIGIGVFALGTLIYTALAISMAPQMVMFVGLTRATFGLDHVRPGGDHDPGALRPGRRPFRWLTRPLLGAFATGLIGLVLFVLVALD
ncbi:MAG TPA: hypothetical protein VF119_08760 [Candidatus Limnocylindrales bacterium]